MRFRYLLPCLVASASAITVWACGSSSDGELTAPAPDAGDAMTTPDGSTSSTSSSGSSGTADGGGDGGTSSGALGGDGGIDPPDAGPGGDLTKVTCGATSCAIPAETCCVSDVGNGALGYACTAGTTCPRLTGGGDTTALKCTSAKNCAAGTVCCVMQTKGVTTSSCQATCTSGNGTDSAQLCDPSAGDGGGCPAADPCSNKSINDWGLPKTFGTCGGKGN